MAMNTEGATLERRLTNRERGALRQSEKQSMRFSVLSASRFGGHYKEIVQELWRLHCDCTFVEKEQELPKIAEHLRPCLLIVDLISSREIELCQAIRQEVDKCEFACVAAAPSAELVVDAIRAGAIDVISALPSRSRLERLVALTRRSLQRLEGREQVFRTDAQSVVVVTEAAPLEEDHDPPPPHVEPTEFKRIQQIERDAILNALSAHKFHAVQAANSLGIGSATMYRKIKLYGIDLDRLRRRQELE